MRTLCINGRVFTGTGAACEAFAVEDGVITAVGTTDAILAMRAEGDEVADFGGKFVCAGFNDSHMHLLNYGNVMGQCQLGGAGSLEDVQGRLRAYIEENRPERGAWVMGRGWNQDYFVPATGEPARDALDAVSTEHPICITRCCGHCLSVNSRALDVLGIDENTPCPDGGSIDRDADGRLTGIFRDTAMDIVYGGMAAADKDEIKRMLVRASHALSAVGVTSCQTDDLCALPGVHWRTVMQALCELRDEGALTVRVYEQSQLTTPEELRDFLAAGYNTGAGDAMLKVGPLKILGDGSLGARTAYMSKGYADAPDERGLALFTQAQMDALIGTAHAAGMQVAVHAIGDGILDIILNSYEKAFDENPRADHRSGVVHVQLTRPDQLERMARLGLHAYVQSVFLDYDTRIVHARAGEELAATSYAFHTMKTLGMHVSNGTDCPVEAPDPMRGVQCAVTRRPIDGSLPPYNPQEAMTVEEALLSYTAEGAYASFEEDVKGRIAPGMLADFVVLSDDPFGAEPGELAKIHAELTVLGGRVVYRKE